MQLQRQTRGSTTREFARRSPVKGCVRSVVLRAATAVGADTQAKQQQLVDVVKTAVRSPGSVPPAALLKGIVELEKLKLKPTGDEWSTLVSGTWRLIYTAPTKDVIAAQKATKGGAGAYVPITAAQNYDPAAGTFENGIFLGPVAHLTFKGQFKWTGRQLQFDVDTMHLGIGPWRVPIQLKKPTAIIDMDSKTQKALPFFMFAYVDEHIMVARGRSGGLAVWGRGDAKWAAQAGVLQVYK